MSRRLLFLRRWVVPGISRQSAANRLMTTSSDGVSSPWLMMEPGQTECGTCFRFWCCAKKREHKYEYELWNWKRNMGRPGVTEGLGFLQRKKNLPAAKLVGSSQGWLAYRFKRRLYLVEPTTYRCIRLPDFQRDMKVTRLVLSPRNPDPDDERESESESESELLGNKALMICGDGSLAFCSRTHQQGGEWSFFSSDADQQYESVVYSPIDRRLLCLTRMMKLEAWDVQGESPTLDWAVHLNHHSHSHSQLQEQEQELGCVRYLACADHIGDLFVVLRFFQKTIQYDDHEDDGDDDDDEEECVYNYEYEYVYEGTHWDIRDIGWYPIDPTLHFEVYKIDRQRGSMMKLEDSLDGMSIFVGMNDSIARKIPQEENEKIYIVPMSREEQEAKIQAGCHTQEERIDIMKEMKMKIKMKNNMKMMKIIFAHKDTEKDKEDVDEFADEDDKEQVEEEEAIGQDCVHFTYDNRIGRNKYIGKFDYKTREVKPLSFPCFQWGFLPAEQDIDIAYPLWFTPTAGSPQGTLVYTDFPATSNSVHD